ncbi:MAG TPA: hypothetical protein VFY90_02740 [Tepidiformaceae bacterium]|nr:hypothetical protein [Tepidiformaceae bacterium]
MAISYLSRDRPTSDASPLRRKPSLDDAEVNLRAGWAGILAGMFSGAALGLFFHREGWLGGYDSFPRRLTRLGHIAFFGLGFINILFAVSNRQLGLAPGPRRAASTSLLVGQATMPAVCFATALWRPFRHLFFIPVASLLLAAANITFGARDSHENWPHRR